MLDQPLFLSKSHQNGEKIPHFVFKKYPGYFLNFTILNAKPVPGSFADLAEKLMPSVVNISTTQTVVTRSNPFPNFFHAELM